MSMEKKVKLLTPVPEPGEPFGDERYVSCEYCGYESKPSKDMKKLEKLVKPHLDGACSPKSKRAGKKGRR